jgi:hypothetical protein
LLIPSPLLRERKALGLRRFHKSPIMHERSPALFARLTLRQLERLRYVAACGPVFRVVDDEGLERLQLVRPFNGMLSVVEVTARAEAAGQDESSLDRLSAASDALFDACQSALREFSQHDWCRHGHGCDDCEGCQRYRNLERAVETAESGAARSAIGA